MNVESINIDGNMVQQIVVPIVGDGACFFRALSFSMFGTQEMAFIIRQELVIYIVEHWDEFSTKSDNGEGDNYSSPEEYFLDMIKPFTYGGICELLAVGKLYNNFSFEVYRGGKLYIKVGTPGFPTKRLRFSRSLSNGHFDVYLPFLELNPTVALNRLNVSTRKDPLESRIASPAAQAKRNRFTRSLSKGHSDINLQKKGQLNPIVVLIRLNLSTTTEPNVLPPLSSATSSAAQTKRNRLSKSILYGNFGVYPPKKPLNPIVVLSRLNVSSTKEPNGIVLNSPATSSAAQTKLCRLSNSLSNNNLENNLQKKAQNPTVVLSRLNVSTTKKPDVLALPFPATNSAAQTKKTLSRRKRKKRRARH